MAVAKSFSLQNLHDFYKISQPKSNNPNLSYLKIADLFTLENFVISEDHEKVRLAFKNLNVKIQSNRSYVRKFAKFKDNEGEKIVLEILTSDMEADYDSQESQNIDNYRIDELQEDLEELSCKDYYKPLTEVCSAQRYRRTGPIISFLQEAAAKNKVTINVLMGILLGEINYHGDKEVCEIGRQLEVGQMKDVKMSHDQTTNLQQGLKLGRGNYQLLKSSLPQEVKILPTWKELRAHQKEISPPLIHQKGPIVGVKYDYKEALCMTIKRTLELVDDTKLPSSGSTLKVKIKDGVDGSGSHSIYQQSNNVDTHNMILFMFCLLEIYAIESNSIIYVEQHPNSPHSMRPLFIVMGKELLSNLGDVKIAFNQRSLLMIFDLEFRNNTYKIQIDARMTMIDGKMRSTISGLGGAYCLLCYVPQSTACGRDGDYTSFSKITRTAAKRREVWNNLVDENQCIKKRKSDYHIRSGLTQEPIVEEDLSLVSPLHAIMRCEGNVQKLIYHLRSETYIWTESPKKLGEFTEIYHKAKTEKHKIIYEETNIKVDIPDATGKGGTTSNGNVCERLLKDHRNVLVSLVPEQFQPALNEFVDRLWIILFIYTSQSKNAQVNTLLFREFCADTYKLLLNNFENSEKKWINVSPTLHMILAHSWELIEINGNYGLGEYSETGLENNNKFLRYFREHLARKNSQETNLEDCINRFWLKSDPVVRQAGPEMYCSRCHNINTHHTVSCSLKKNQAAIDGPIYHSCLTFHDFHISRLYL